MASTLKTPKKSFLMNFLKFKFKIERSKNNKHVLKQTNSAKKNHYCRNE